MNGLFSDPGFPHKGWEEVDCEDLGAGNYEYCEACSRQEIRYVHILRHDNYPNDIRVGCVCAENLIEGYCGKEKERKARRLHNFINNKRWSINQYGNFTISYKQYTVEICPIENVYKVSICKIPVQNNKWKNGEKEFNTLEEAKKAAFKGIFFLKKKEQK